MGRRRCPVHIASAESIQGDIGIVDVKVSVTADSWWDAFSHGDRPDTDHNEAAVVVSVCGLVYRASLIGWKLKLSSFLCTKVEAFGPQASVPYLVHFAMWKDARSRKMHEEFAGRCIGIDSTDVPMSQMDTALADKITSTSAQAYRLQPPLRDFGCQLLPVIDCRCHGHGHRPTLASSASTSTRSFSD